MRTWSVCRGHVVIVPSRLVSCSPDDLFFFGRYEPRRLRLQLSVPTKLIETNKHKKTAVKQRSELLNYLLQHADFVSSGCSATWRKFLSATQQK